MNIDQGARKCSFKVYLITDRTQTGGRPLLEVVNRALGAGIEAVQLREKDLSGRDLFNMAEELREITSRAGAQLLINDRADVAVAVGADGVHLTRKSISAEKVRMILGPHGLIGQSTHSTREAIAAQEEGADFVTLGPIYPTPSKLKYGAPLGREAIAAARDKVSIPIYAIGGIKQHNVRQVIDAGAVGVALISAILGAADVEGAVLSLLGETGNQT